MDYRKDFPDFRLTFHCPGNPSWHGYDAEKSGDTVYYKSISGIYPNHAAACAFVPGFFGVTKTFGIQLSGQVSAVIVFTLWGTAEMGDLVRGALISIPKHQYESGAALGLDSGQIYRYIIIPQTLRRLIPLAINLTTRMIKTTSLIVLIGVVEVMKTAQQIIEANRYTVPDSALWIYGTVFFLYFLVCWPVSGLAARMEKKWEC